MNPSNWKRWHYKDIRDPIHGFIGVTQKECDILDSPYMQRLRGIKQLACTHLIYPGATHTRFEHSLGVLHIADRIAQKLEFPDDEREIVRFAALLHDIGHGPFSHVFDIVMTRIHGEYDHAQMASRVIKHTGLYKKLGKLQDKVLLLLDDPKNQGKLGDVISSALDADRMDYLKRDSYYVGVEYGHFDLERIIHTLDVYPINAEKEVLVIDEKGVGAVTGFLLARYHMHLQVYQHRTRLITDAMLVRCLQKAIEKENISELSILKSSPSSSSFIKTLLKLTDEITLNIIKRKAKRQSKALAIMIGERKLLKSAFEQATQKIDAVINKQLVDDSSNLKITLSQKEEEIAKKAGVDEGWIFIYLTETKNPLFKDPLHWKFGEILVLGKDEITSSFSETSPLFGAGEPSVSKVFVFCRQEDKPDVEAVVPQCIPSR